MNDISEVDRNETVEENSTVRVDNINSQNLVNAAMELMQAEEIFEVNSNSTTDTLKEQRLARNKELRLKATYLVSRRPMKNQQKDYNSESSSEFPASSPSNPQMQRNSQYQLLKNSLPADEFERGLALIATKTPQMTMSEKIESWQCVTESFSDVEDVVNFDTVFKQREEQKNKLLSEKKNELENEPQKEDNTVDDKHINTCYSFTEFQSRLLAIDPRKSNLHGNELKHNSKMTSEEDEKPTTSSNCLARNRDTPLKKRACKYKRAAEPIAHLPNKKSSSSDTPRDGAPSAKKKAQQQKLSAATAAGEDGHQLNEKMVCPSSSDASGQLVKNVSKNIGTRARNLRSQAQTKSKPTKIIEARSINNWNRAIPSTNSARNEEQGAFFRWRRLSREIDKLGNIIEKNANQKDQKNGPSKEKQRLIQIRYDFLDPNKDSTNVNPEKKTYNVVVKSLKNEELLKGPTEVLTTNNKPTNSSSVRNIEHVPLQHILKSEETFLKTEQLKETEIAKTTYKDNGQDSGLEFHQQHVFCNYLGLTGMSTANAMANAAAELSKCNLARRSLRVRHLEQRKAKSKTKSEPQKKAAKEKQESSNNLIASNPIAETTNQSSKNSTKKTSVGTESLRSETKRNKTSKTALSATVPCIQKAKENEAKIKILCQIATPGKEKEEQNIMESIEQPTTNLQHTLKQQNQQNNFQYASKSKTIVNIEDKKVDTKYIELLAKTTCKRNFNANTIEESSEVQKLHEKVQKCLEEARQNVPNIFIVQSLDSTSATAVSQKEVKNADITEGKVKAFDSVSSRTKISLQSNKSTVVNNAVSTKVTKRKTRGHINKTKVNRKLYTRSMLNLNQQRELRNRKVILKILKTYSGLKIKVSKSKKKMTTEKKQNDTNKPNKRSIVDIAPNSVETVSDLRLETSPTNSTKKSNKIETETSIDDVKVTSKLEETTLLVDTNIQHETELLESTKNEIKAVFPNDAITPKSIENSIPEQASSSNMLTSENPQRDPTKNNSELENKVSTATMTDVAVQTDPTTTMQVLQVFAEGTKCKTNELLQQYCINAETDVSSSDMVTSTTSGVGDHNRCDLKTPSNLVTKDVYGNVYVNEPQVGAIDAASSPSVLVESNPLVNISISSTMNELGIHALCEPTKGLQNPLQTDNGSVLHIFYEFDILIVIQERLISFWKYMRALNALMVKPCEVHIDELPCRTKFTNNCGGREMQTPELQSFGATEDFRHTDIDDIAAALMNGCEWVYLGEQKRLCTDIEIGSPYMNRLCLSESRPIYIEMRCRELRNDFRECNLLSCYVNVYYFNEEDQIAVFHSIQLDSVQSLPSDVIYTAINDSRYFVLAWPQANVLGKVRSGLCKYALTPDLDMLATTRDFKAMRHILRSLECLSDGKLLGFGDTQLTVWDHRSGDVLMNYDLSLPLGRNLGTIYYPTLESGQNNVVVLIQHVQNESSSDLVVIACTISHMNPTRRVLLRHRLSNPPFSNIRNGVNNGEHIIIQSSTGEEILISCNDPRHLMFVPAQHSERFYSRGRAQVIELTKQTLTVDTFSSYLLKIAAGFNVQKTTTAHKNKSNTNTNTNWCV